MLKTFQRYSKWKKMPKDRKILSEYVHSCGLDPKYIHNQFAVGLQHYIYDYRENEQYVLKVPKFDLPNLLYGLLNPKDVHADWQLITKYFPEYALETDIYSSATNNYVIVQRKVKNLLRLSSSNIHLVGKQFREIYQRNKIMEDEYGFSLDLWGKSGVIKTISKSLPKLKVFVEMSNLVIDKSNKEYKLKIVDTNLFRIGLPKVSFSRLITDKVIYSLSDVVLKNAKFFNY